MSKARFSFASGVTNAIMTVILFVLLPSALFQVLQQAIPGLSLGENRTVTVTATGVLVAIVAFCRGAFPRHSVIWALAGIGWSLFSAAYLYFLLGTPASYTILVGGQTVIIFFDISLFALVISVVMALNSLGNLIELFEARRRIIEKGRLQVTEIAA
ncbi:MAG: hypothetical protein WED04_13370 [Promethearchaeati archaeon SRVP18_Atabeyarchaeia-1]